MSERERVRAALAGQQGWEECGSASEHLRYMDEMGPRYRNRSRCTCGCEGKKTHCGLANGLALMSGCEWSVRQWVRGGRR